MSDAKSYNGVTPAIFDCVKKTSEAEHGTKYTPGDKGTATTTTPVGTVVLGFSLDPAASTLTYTIDKKPFIVPASTIWDGVSDTINKCRR
jgi:hypothetical protein